jgi:hypothetical protein
MNLEQYISTVYKNDVLWFTKEVKRAFGLVYTTMKNDKEKNTKNNFYTSISVECVGGVIQYIDGGYEVNVYEDFQDE